MSETLEMPLNTVNEWLNKEINSIVDPLRVAGKKILADTQAKLEELSDACDKLLDDAEKEMEKGSRKTYRRAKFLYKLAGTFSDLIEKITIPDEINGKTLNETSDQIEKTMKTIGQEKTKWFRAISPYFIISRRRFDVSFKRTDDSLRNLTDFLAEKYAKAESAENVFSNVDELRQSLVDLNDYETGKETRKQKKELLETSIATSQQNLQAIQNKGEIVELVQLDARIEELSETVKHELRHIKKSLLKFQTLVKGSGYNLVPDATSKLDEYLTSPFDAMATEKEGYPLLRNFLQKIDTALDNKKMKLKPSRLRKAKDQIDRIVNKDALVSLHKDCIEAFNKKTELSTSGTINECRDETARLHDHLNDLQRQMKLLKTRDTMFEKEHKEVHKRVEEQKRSLEKIVSDLSDKTVHLILG